MTNTKQREEFNFYLRRCYRIWSDVKAGKREVGEIDKAENDYWKYHNKAISQPRKEVVEEVASLIYDPTEPFQETLLTKLEELGWKQHSYDSGRAFLEKKGVPIVKDKHSLKKGK